METRAPKGPRIPPLPSVGGLLTAASPTEVKRALPQDEIVGRHRPRSVPEWGGTERVGRMAGRCAGTGSVLIRENYVDASESHGRAGKMDGRGRRDGRGRASLSDPTPLMAVAC
jgi:hypothetical protein